MAFEDGLNDFPRMPAKDSQGRSPVDLIKLMNATFSQANQAEEAAAPSVPKKLSRRRRPKTYAEAVSSDDEAEPSENGINYRNTKKSSSFQGKTCDAPAGKAVQKLMTEFAGKKSFRDGKRVDRASSPGDESVESHAKTAKR